MNDLLFLRLLKIESNGILRMMAHLFNFGLTLAVVLAVHGPVEAQESPEEAARAALNEYFRAWNAADNEAIALVSNFPRVSVGPSGQIVVRDTAEDIAIDFDTLRAAELWDHSTLDLVDVAHSSADKVHFRVVASRRYANGSPYRTNPGLYIVTQQDGHWGLQLQSVLPATFSAAP
tara:strand:- start:558 stop:1085 length:528 start_codon:yes stop_codon:yes gene_type:complete